MTGFCGKRLEKRGKAGKGGMAEMGSGKLDVVKVLY